MKNFLDQILNMGKIEIETQSQLMHDMKVQDERKKINDQFREYLKDSGHFFTPQRRQVLDEIEKSDGHFDVEELILQIRKNKVKVSRATVYRTIGHLERSGFIRKISLDEPHSHYELIPGSREHEHMQCERCGRVIEFFDPNIAERIQKIAALNNFAVTRRNLQIFGICEECRRIEKVREEEHL